MKTLATNISGLPTWTYGPDGEARVSSIAASSGPNPLTSTTYNGFGPTGVTFGSGDSDSFSYDPNTGRETQYKFTVNGANETGTLTWNANGTLQKLAISDPFIAANTQTCTNTYDDLMRLIANNCGSVWSQTFGYDAFGNITKSGTISFQPTYSPSTNRYNTLPTGTLRYDLNGNLQNDSFHSYDWNAEGLNTDIDSSATSMIYDALGRWVERRNAGTVEAVYGPDGRELVVTIGQSLVAGYVALPAGATALYLSSGQLGNWWHPDWLGTARLYSNPSHVVVGDAAYAPFGERYNSAPIDSFFTGVAMNVEANDFRNFPARDLHTTEGRWLTPDPAGLAAVDLTNPQTLNRYAYVMNNPLGLVDPTGMCADFDSSCFSVTKTISRCPWWNVFCWLGGNGTGTSPEAPSEFDASNPGVNPNGGLPGGPISAGVGGTGGRSQSGTTRILNCVAFQAVNAAYDETKAQTLEYGGFIVKKPNQTYYYTTAFAGSQISMGSNFYTQFNRLVLSLGKGYSVAGWYHDHPIGPPRYDPEHMSDGDRGATNYIGGPGFLLTPTRHFWRVDPRARPVDLTRTKPCG